MNYTTIVSTETLANHLNDPDWLVIDCRFDLNQPQWGSDEYHRAHIPGALYADLKRDLSGPKTATSGRHPLPEPQNWRDTLSAWGVHPETQVVAYDATGGGMAAVRLWWLMRAYGHLRVAILDGCFPKWLRENLPTESGAGKSRNPTTFTGGLDPLQMATSDDITRILKDPHYRLIDGRAADRFRGEIEPIDPVAGHIPGACNRPSAENMNPDLTFKPAPQLRAEFIELLGNTDPQNVIAYCGSGVTGSHNLLAMEIAGLTGGKLYPGSWSEWIRDPNRPIETGAGAASH